MPSTDSPRSPSATCAPASFSTSPTGSSTSSASTCSQPSTLRPARSGTSTERNIPLNLSEVARLAGARGNPTARPSNTEITLFTSDRDGVVGHVDGDNWRWARTAMDLAGFHKTDEGHHTLPLDDVDRAREVLITLHVVSEIAGVRINSSSDKYIGDFARDLAEHLAGPWTVRVENYALKVWQEDLAACLWSTGYVADTLDQHRVRRTAILQRDDGTELTVLKDPRRDVYHVGALHPRDQMPDDFVAPPPGVTVQPAPSAAAHVIRGRLLPAYTRAVLHSRANSLADDLTWVRETYEAGTIPEPPPAVLVDAFTRFTTAAPHVVAAVRDLGTLDEHETAFLKQVDDMVGTPAPATSTPRVVPHADPLAWWLIEGGDGLVTLAHRTIADAKPPAGAASTATKAIGPPRALPPAPARSSSATPCL
ncbi:hypothetical protein [Streptomyces roseoviridis]|uniref:Uncharacterized protein n=1 Tax=Streptomyces roseoviridis TaxID=67361 RepID=A0ABV5QTJ5_9ACTN